jgi:ArsR family transcriptional regulator
MCSQTGSGRDIERACSRLARLVETGFCPADRASKYAEELKAIAKGTYDERALRSSARFFKALSDQTRLKILKLLTVRSMCVCEIMVALEMSQPTASHHLNILENAGLVKKRRQGKWIFHSLASTQVIEMLDRAVSTQSR